MVETLKEAREGLAQYIENESSGVVPACEIVRSLRAFQINAIEAERAAWVSFIERAFTEGFMGWWDDGDKEDCPEPWERFRVMLFGEEAADTTDFGSGSKILLEAIERMRASTADPLDAEEPKP